MERLLFVVNGLGLGNSTRCHSIMQHLCNMGMEISVATSGNGLWYFSKQPEVSSLHELNSLYYGQASGQISMLQTVFAAPKMVSTLKTNSRSISKIIANERPAAMITDSVYNFRPAKLTGVPIIALNNSDLVVHYIGQSKPPWSIRGQYYGVELMDYLFHRFVPDLVISPSIDPDLPTVHPHFRRVAPIVRQNYKPGSCRKRPERVVIMLSGSVFGSPVHLSRDYYPFHIDIIGRDNPPGCNNSDRIRYHSKLINNLLLLEDADLVMVNGGFSAISEAFCMRKPMVVVPVPRHAEQWVNGKVIEKLGVGMTANEDDIEQAILVAVDRVDEFRSAYESLGNWKDGARQAAEHILSFIADR